jgi:hypothetical protein
MFMIREPASLIDRGARPVRFDSLKFVVLYVFRHNRFVVNIPYNRGCERGQDQNRSDTDP